MKWYQRFLGLLMSRVDTKSGLGARYYKTYQQSYNYWTHNSIFIENIFHKIANDASLVNFRHLKITKNDNAPDLMDWLEDSDLTYILNRRPNDSETPTTFWNRVVRQMLKNDVAVIIPVYENSRLKSIELVKELVSYDSKNITISVNGVEYKYPINQCWVFENPREGLATNLNEIVNLINMNLERLMEKLANPSNLKGLLKITTAVEDNELKKRAEMRVSNIMDVASNGNIGYLQKGEEFQELNQTYNTASSEELEFLKQQLSNSYGLNNKLLNCEYDEQIYRAYHQSILTPIINTIKEEIEYKNISKTAYTQGQRVAVYFDFYNVTSLKDLSDFAFRMKYSGIMNSNEIREIFGYGQFSGGDLFTDNKNSVFLNSNDNDLTQTEV